MSFSQTVDLKNGGKKNVVAASEEDLKEAVKQAGGEEAPKYPNINRPVQKGHDLVQIEDDMSKTYVNGEGAHNSPNNAIDEDGKEEGDSRVKASGLEEPLYKTVPEGGNGGVNGDLNPSLNSDGEVKSDEGSDNTDTSTARKSSKK